MGKKRAIIKLFHYEGEINTTVNSITDRKGELNQIIQEIRNYPNESLNKLVLDHLSELLKDTEDLISIQNEASRL